MVDAAAAAGDCDVHTRLDLAAQRLAGQFILNGLDNLVLRDVCVARNTSRIFTIFVKICTSLIRSVMVSNENSSFQILV